MKTQKCCYAHLRDQRGSTLIAIVIGLTVVASLGTAIYTFTSTSSRNQLSSMNESKAYYMAESGGQYGIKRLVDCERPTEGCTNRDTLLTELAASPFIVTNAGQFSLQNFAYDGSTSPGYSDYKFAATGWPPDLSVSRSINYIVPVPTTAGVSIPFDASDNDNHSLNENNWNVSGDASLDTSDQKISLDSDSADTQVSLDWNNENSTLPNLLKVWNNSNGLMTYEAQIKVKLDDGDDVMAGLSFRLNTGGNTNISDDSFYGLSYLWCKDGHDLGDTLCPSDNKTYIVLWKKLTGSSTKIVLGKQLASTVSTSLVNSGKLVDWSTLVVRIQEQFNPTTHVRENLISSFAGSANINPKGTIHWDYTKYSAIAWEAATFTGIDCSGGLRSLISDSTFLTTDFNTQPQDEIGIHTFGEEKGELADLALRFDFNGGKATTCTASSP